MRCVLAQQERPRPRLASLTSLGLTCVLSDSLILTLLQPARTVDLDCHLQLGLTSLLVLRGARTADIPRNIVEAFEALVVVRLERCSGRGREAAAAVLVQKIRQRTSPALATADPVVWRPECRLGVYDQQGTAKEEVGCVPAYARLSWASQPTCLARRLSETGTI